MTEGRVRAIAAQVASAIAAKIKPSVSEEQIRSDVEAVIRQMQEDGELTGSDLTDEQIAAVQENAEAAAGSATTASNAATAAQTAQGKAETAQTAAESAKSTAAQMATDATNAAQTATSKATEASESATAAGTAKTAAEEAAARAEEAANRLLGVAVVGVIDENGNLVLTGLLEDGTYTAYYEVQNDDGTKSLVEIGDLAIGLPASYTIRWLNYDNTVLRTDTVTEGETPSYGATPTRPDDDTYTYTFAGWEPTVVPAVANADYKARYTGIPKVNNLLDPTQYQHNKRISVSDGTLKDLAGAVASNFIPITMNQTFHISGITLLSTSDYNAIVFYNASGAKVSSTSFAFTGIQVSGNTYSMTPSDLTASNSTITQFRFSCDEISADAVVTVS